MTNNYLLQTIFSILFAVLTSLTLATCGDSEEVEYEEGNIDTIKDDVNTIKLELYKTNRSLKDIADVLVKPKNSETHIADSQKPKCANYVVGSLPKFTEESGLIHVPKYNISIDRSSFDVSVAALSTSTDYDELPEEERLKKGDAIVSIGNVSFGLSYVLSERSSFLTDKEFISCLLGNPSNPRTLEIHRKTTIDMGNHTQEGHKKVNVVFTPQDLKL